MTKSKRNLLVSVLVLILTVAIAGGSTYAWFTTNLNVKVDPMDIQVTTGSKGLYVSADKGVTWKTKLDTADLLKAGYDPATVKLSDVTSSNGIEMTKTGPVTPTPAAPIKGTDYVEFTVQFRVTGAKSGEVPKVFLSALTMADNSTLNQSFANSTETTFTELTYGKTGSGTIAPGGTMTASATHAARMSFQTQAIKADGSYDSTKPTTAKVWDPFKEKTNTYCGVGTSADTNASADWNVTAVSNFALQYYLAASGGTYATTINLPDTMFGVDTYDGSATVSKTNAFNADVLSLGWVTDKKTYESELTVRIWLEGFDGDCFNAILNDKILTNMTFSILNK